MQKAYPIRFQGALVAVGQCHEYRVTIKATAGGKRSAQSQLAAGAGERGAAPGCRVSVADWFSGKRLYRLVSELATEVGPVAFKLGR